MPGVTGMAHRIATGVALFAGLSACTPPTERSAGGPSRTFREAHVFSDQETGVQIRISEPVLVSADAPSSRHAETVLAINPADPGNLIVAAIRLDDPLHTVVYTSHDAGRSWRRARDHTGTPLADPSDDPSIAFDARGRAYFLARAAPSVRVRRSLDGGAVWDAGAEVPIRAPDRPWLLTAAGASHLLVVAKQEVQFLQGEGEMFVVSVSRARLHDTDAALRFSGPRLLLPQSRGRWDLHAVTAVTAGPDGTAAATMLNCGWPPVGGRLDCALVAATSDDGGWTFDGLATIARVQRHTHADPWLMLKGAGLGGLAIARTGGQARGRMYAVWSDFQTERYQVAAAASDDGGRSWSSPAIVNDDATSANHSNPGIAVNSAGVVAVVWHDSRNDPNDSCFQPMIAVSIDGARSFSANTPIHSARACTVTGRGEAAPERFAQGGDTFGIDAAPDGTFYVAWVGPGPEDRPSTWRLFVNAVEVRRLE